MYARFSHSFDGTIRAIAVAYAFVVAIIVANVIVASRLTNGRVRLSISLILANRSRDLRAPISRSCHSLPGSSSILVLAFVRAKESNLNRYRRKRISPISNIIDSKKKNIIVGSLLFTMYKCCNARPKGVSIFARAGGEKGGENFGLGSK